MDQRLNAGASLKRLAVGLGVGLAAHPLAAQTVNVSGLSDVSFTDLRTGGDVRRAQSVCVFSDLPTRGYMITVRGSGSGGAFVLEGLGAGDLAYSVEWSDRPGENTGMPLLSGIALGGQTSAATDAKCSNGAVRSASLILVIAREELAAGRSGVNYSGTLSLTFAPQ